MPRLNVLLLGPPRIELDGEPIAVDTRKAIALLAYLAVTGSRQSRERLAALLWPDHDTDHARGALRRTLSSLNKALGGQGLEIDRSAVALVPQAFSLDVGDFRAALTEGRLADAVALYRGDLLEGFGLRDSVEFDDWQLFEGEGLKREYAGALDALARSRAELGELDAAIELARRRLAIDTLQEPAHRLLMQLYAWSGSREAAVRQYRECVRILDEELGVSPLEETTELYQAIVEGRLPTPTPRPAAATSPGEARPLPLVGRADAWRALLEAHRDGPPEGRLVAIEGEAGIGKTRLVDEFAAHVRAQGQVVVATRCSEGESALAYGAVLEALRASLRAGGTLEAADRTLSEASRLLPELAELRPGLPEPPPLDRPGAQSRFLDALAELLAASASVVAVDDAQWADEPSLEVLAYLARRLERRPVTLLLAWRSEDASAGARLRRLVADAARDGRATTVELTRLGPDDVAALARAAGADELADRLFGETGGLPLFVVEYLAVAEGEGWDGQVPRGIKELLEARLAVVGETGSQVLAAGAAVGRPFDLATARDVSGRSDDEAVAALEELTRRGLLVEGDDGYAFGHERMRALVYERTSLARRRLLHRRAAEALAARARRDPGGQAALVAEHYRLAGEELDAAEWFVVAGDRARALFANVEARDHFESALALGHADPGALHEAIGDLDVLLGAYGGALSSYEAAAAHSASEGLPELEHKLGLVHHRRGDWELAASHLEAALRGLEDPRLRARAEADLSLNEHRRRHADDALAAARRSLELAESARDELALAQAHNMLGILASSRGELSEARSHLERSLALAERLGDPGARVAALNNLALNARAAGELDRALELTGEALDLCVVQGDRHREAALRNNLADLLHTAGQDEAAMTELKRAVGIFAEIGAEAGESEPEIWKLVEW
jgi:DNA-binding SARP family transcriptional activator